MPINKVYASCEEAVADIFDGASIMVGGFAGPGGVPQNLLVALRNQGAKNLTVIVQTVGMADIGGAFGNKGGAPYIDSTILAESRQIKKAIAAFPGSPWPSRPTTFERQYVAGEVELELVPQGTLAERIRAGGAGIGGFFTPTGAGTIVGEGKESRIFDGREYILEYPLRADFALIRAHKADKMGNLVYKGTSRTFNPVMATAAEITIVEVDEIVEPGEIDPEVVVTPGIFVGRIVKIAEGGWR